MYHDSWLCNICESYKKREKRKRMQTIINIHKKMKEIRLRKFFFIPHVYSPESSFLALAMYSRLMAPPVSISVFTLEKREKEEKRKDEFIEFQMQNLFAAPAGCSMLISAYVGYELCKRENCFNSTWFRHVKYRSWALSCHASMSHNLLFAVPCWRHTLAQSCCQFCRIYRASLIPVHQRSQLLELDEGERLNYGKIVESSLNTLKPHPTGQKFILNNSSHTKERLWICMRTQRAIH